MRNFLTLLVADSDDEAAVFPLTKTQAPEMKIRSVLIDGLFVPRLDRHLPNVGFTESPSK